jgi:PadR family transcriptional regulator PadR
MLNSKKIRVIQFKQIQHMNTENTKAQMRKGILEFCILSLICKKEMYVSDLIEELKKGKLEVVEGTLYPLLTRLKNGEFLSYRWEESTGGPPLKYYQITEKGNLFLTELQNTWQELTVSVQQITSQN